ncbi:MAG: hypothetical protein H7245_21585 [Candidatus Saccharibacteria bacterium]|nr:hypothetical protein [Pseudorhodobacter sp.]
MTKRQIGIIFHGIGEPSRTLEPGEAPYWITVAAFDALLDRIKAHPEPDRFRLTFDGGNLFGAKVSRLCAMAIPLRKRAGGGR